MSYVNDIQNKILQLEGGAFQKIFDAYLYKKYKFDNIQTLGVQTGANKPTKGIPDSYVLTAEGKYILINYGSVASNPVVKIKKDILSCFNTAKLTLPKEQIRKIICGHCSTNINLEQFQDIKESIEGVDIELIGIDTLSHDLALIYPHIAKDYLGVGIDTNQFFDIEDFVKAYDANGIKARINCDFLYRKDELDAVCNSITNNIVTMLTGPSGIGKTRLALEACRKQCDDESKVYCVLSNGNLLYEDIKYYMDTPGKYLIFFDDANMVIRLDNVLHTIMALPKEYEVKILITVRDYAKKDVKDCVIKYSSLNEIEIKELDDDEIKDILRKNLGICNTEYLNKIVEIANGNMRLAILAGMTSKKEGYQAIRNAEDIFSNYYGGVLKETALTAQEIMMLFIIAVTGPTNISNTQLYLELKEQYCKDISDEMSIHKLYSLELIDWFKNEVVKVSDQSLGNYVLYYVIFIKKWVSLESLLAIGFPKYKQKIIYVLNTINQIFYSDELSSYVIKAIISAWDCAPQEYNKLYLEEFYLVAPDKALCMLKRYIDNDEKVMFDLHGFDFEKQKNYHHVDNNIIGILGGYKYTNSYEIAVELFLCYFSKRSDLIMDFYFTIVDRMMFDKNSRQTHYKKEAIFLDLLWEATANGANYNYTFLYLHIAEYALKTEFSVTEQGRKNKSISYARYLIAYSDDIAVLRKKIWATLGILRQRNDYRLMVNHILFKIHFNVLNNDSAIEYLKLDFDAIYSNVLCVNNIDFDDARIIDKYREVAERLGIAEDIIFSKSDENAELRLYKILTQDHLMWKTHEEWIKNKKKFISQEICLYKLLDYKKLFEICNKWEDEAQEINMGELNTGLECVFELLEDNDQQYVDVFTIYLDANAPFALNERRIIKYLLAHIGYSKTYELLNSRVYKNKDIWLWSMWECLFGGNITSDMVDDFNRFTASNIEQDTNIIPSVAMLDSVCCIEPELWALLIKKIVGNPVACNSFLSRVVSYEAVDRLLLSFKNNIKLLSKIYINACSVGYTLDFDGRIFNRIFAIYPQIWNEYVDLLIRKMHFNECEKKIFESIWNSENWCECVNYAFDNLIYEEYGLVDVQAARLLFLETDNNEINRRKKKWLIEALHKNIDDIKRCRILIDIVVTVMPNWKLDYLLEFLKSHKKIDDFKDINVFPLSNVWSGSEIPLILDEINFLKKLKEHMKSIDFIEHRNYIDERCSQLEIYKNKVEVREYLENNQYF